MYLLTRIKYLLSVLSILGLTQLSSAQFEQKQILEPSSYYPQASEILLDHFQNLPTKSDRLNTAQPFEFNDYQLDKTSLQTTEGSARILQRDKNGYPSWIRGNVGTSRSDDPKTAAYTYLEAIKSLLPVNDVHRDFIIKEVDTEESIGMKHIRLQQKHLEIPIFSAEIWLHEKEGKINSMNGRLLNPEADLPGVILEEHSIETKIREWFGDKWESVQTNLPDIHIDQIDMHLFWFEDPLSGRFDLVYIADVYPDYIEKWMMYISATDGKILKAYPAMCTLHTQSKYGVETHQNNRIKSQHKAESSSITLAGDATAVATDLLGINRTLHVYEASGVFYLIDISKSMFNDVLSSMPNEPHGAVWTVDGQNRNFQGSNFGYNHVANTNNNWTDATAVSAHHNASVAFDYFKNTFNRNSIDGNNGTIISIIHVDDQNGDMDNAFWNGFAMFYGDGNQAFNHPLARGLDVAGHEMTHGVIQNTANLIYEDEPGALNESFADVFGVLIDRNDWKVGEDVVNTGIYPSGALRDMQNPHNGGFQLGDPGWQPAHTSEKYNGSQDNGGVHINSGIPNRAFAIFANSVGKDKAEQVYYRALNHYLTRSSNFKDCRVAVMQSALDLYGSNEEHAAAAAFDQVGISGSGGSGNQPTELQVNPGDDIILAVDVSTEFPLLVDENINMISNPLAEEKPISRPSVTDDGSVIVFINEDGFIYMVQIDWQNLQIIQSGTISTSDGWRNVAIAKDGSLLAATRNTQENKIVIIDLDSGLDEEFELYNPTTVQGVTTGDVLYCDAMEFDYSGKYLMYDAFNRIEGDMSDDIEYWDIGFLRVWDRQGNSFGDGHVSKLFSGLPEGVSVGNATFSKQNPSVISFDYLEEGFLSTNIEVRTADIENSIIKSVFSNKVVGYPNYSRTDDRLLFNAEDNQSNPVIAQVQLAADKITPVGDASIWATDGFWAVWFGTGERNLHVSVSNDALVKELQISPNPVSEKLIIQTADIRIEDGILRIIDLNGKIIKRLKHEPNNSSQVIDTRGLHAGYYIIELASKNEIYRQSFIKK
jgi:Zn-dependent metalloprotease